MENLNRETLLSSAPSIGERRLLPAFGARARQLRHKLAVVKGGVHDFLNSNYFAPSCALLAGVALSVTFFAVVSNQIEDEAQLRFERQASDARHVIKARILSYVDVIRGVTALFHTSSATSRAEFHRYVSGLKLEQNYPGFHNLNYAQLVLDQNKTAFESGVRQDLSLDPRGYPDFSIKPSGRRNSYSVLVYQEPMESNAITFGKDLAAAPRVERALQKGRDSGELIASGSLIRVEGPNKHVALAMRMPVYRNDMPQNSVEQRRAAYLGSVGAGFNVKRLMQGVLDKDGLQNMRFRLYDHGVADEGKPGPLLHNRDNFLFDSDQLLAAPYVESDLDAGGDLLKSSLTMEIGGRTWELIFSARPEAVINRFDASLPWLALLGGMLSSVFLSWAFYAISTSRSRAVKIAKAMTKNLRENQANLAEAQRTAHLGSLALNRADGGMHWSAETFRIFGLDAGAISPDFGEFLKRIHADDRARLHTTLAQVFSSASRISGEYRISHCDGTIRWAQIIFQPSRISAEVLLNGTIMDITERKQATLLAEVEHRVTQLVASAACPDQVLPEILETLSNGLGYLCAVFRAPDSSGVRLMYEQSWGFDGENFAPFLAMQREAPVFPGCGVAGRAWQKRTPVVRSRFAAGMEQHEHAAMPPEVYSVFACPVVLDDKVFGVIECFGTTRYQPYDGLQKMLVSVGGQISLYLQRKSAENNLRHVANHDSLTDLPNRSMFNQTLHQALLRHSRYGEGLAALFIDIDRFKVINDTLGHGAGDLLLVEFSRRLTECLRESDIVARLGGDEFAVMIERFTSLDDVVAVVEKILNSSAQAYHIEGKEFRTTASIGIAIAPDDGSDVETLLKNADVAMYRAKVNGNSYQFYSPKMNEDSLKRFTLESSLRHAVERGEMFLHYQPKLDLRSGSVTGVEALLRWKHPQLGMVSPAEFIPLAEESGLIIEIGKWVLKMACQQNVEWQRQGLPAMRVAVNLSPRQFRDEKLLQDISGILDDTGLAAEWLEIEVTESMVMHDARQAILVLQQLKLLGIRLSIDDFGTGYSSLAYLRHLPVDCVKIDRSFIKDIPNEADDMAITAGIIGLAHCLRLEVVAEGIETADQLEFLRANGCDEIQGYFFSKPLPLAEITSLLEHNCHKSLAADVGVQSLALVPALAA
ncbi:MAG: EAL domain-containing protein [Pseudomonadota bacterium]